MNEFMDILKYFDVPAILAGCLLASVALGAINLTPWGKATHNGWIAPILSIAAASLLTAWEGDVSVRTIVVQFTMTTSVTFIFALTKGQLAVDKMVAFIAGRIDK